MTGAETEPTRRPSLAERWIAALSRLCGVIAALMIMTAVMITCQMIWMRAVLNASTIWQTEAVTYLMIAATMIGLPYVQLLRGHVNVDLVPLMLPRPARRVLAVIMLGVTAAVMLAMLGYGYELFHMALSRGWRSDTVWGVPMWIPYLAIPVGFGLYLLQLAADIWGALRGTAEPLTGRDPAERR